jgi:hypothetical protein
MIKIKTMKSPDSFAALRQSYAFAKDPRPFYVKWAEYEQKLKAEQEEFNMIDYANNLGNLILKIQ